VAWPASSEADCYEEDEEQQQQQEVGRLKGKGQVGDANPHEATCRARP
jgi:hypothetical protein